MHAQTILTILATAAATVTAAAISSSNSPAQQATCPSTNGRGAQLLSQNTADGRIICRYLDGRVCTYLSSDGSLDIGSFYCADSIRVLRRHIHIFDASTDDGARADGDGSGILSKRTTCAAADDNGGALIEQSASGNNIACDYQQAGRCEYFPGGSFSSGSSVCPDSLSEVAVAPLPAPAPKTECPAEDKNGSGLVVVGVDENGNEVSCRYTEAGLCTYFSNGSFESGSSVCPSSI